MVKLRTGPPMDHVMSSHGPDKNVYQFYHTRYGNEYGKNFRSQTGRDGRTGYSANFRPVMSYSRSQDMLDNPVMGYLLTDNYETVTKRHYVATRAQDGSNLPRRVITKAESGFVRERPLTVPLLSEVKSVFHDTKPYGGYSYPGISPQHRPLLHTLKKHDPTEEENFRRGVQYMSTETKAKFRGEPTAPLNIHHKDVGNLEDTGFTHNKAIEPVTYTYDNNYRGEIQPLGVNGQVESETIEKFFEWHDSNGRDPLPPIKERSSHETGFVRQKSRHLYTFRKPEQAYLKLKDAPSLTASHVQKNDPSEYLNMVYPHNGKSVTKGIFQGKNKVDRDLRVKFILGDKEPSGDSINNSTYIETKDSDRTRYLTNYNLRHYDMNCQGVDREGWVMGGLQGPQEDGYRRDFKVHSFGRSLDTSKRLQQLQPFVGRSLCKRDEFYDDHLYDRKLYDHFSAYKQANSTATLKSF